MYFSNVAKGLGFPAEEKPAVYFKVPTAYITRGQKIQVSLTHWAFITDLPCL